MANASQISKAPQPEEGESVERFCIRAHQQLLSEVPDSEERNKLVWEAWDAHAGQQPERRIADSTFTPDKFTISPAHCHFVEHETVGRDGKPRKYTVTDLAQIARQHNSEIREANHFPAISNGHTPESPEADEPDLLGHAGPYRLGMIGRDKPRFALFADEYHRNDSSETLGKKPFRSVELWTFKDGRRRFHPIAAVGSESPRLLMPAKYSAASEAGQFDDFQHEGANVERYTVAAIGGEADVEKYEAGMAAMAGGSNTFVKGPVKDKENYADVQGPDTPDGIRMIMQALQATPEFVFLRKMMEDDAAMQGDGDDMAGDTPLEDGSDMGPGEPDGDEDMTGIGEDDSEPSDDDDGSGEPSGPPDVSDLDDVIPGKKPEKHTLFIDSDDLDQVSKEVYAMAANDTVSVEKYTELKTNHNQLVEKYTQLQRSHESLIGSQKKLHERVERVEREGEENRRKSKLGEMAEKYSLAFDAEAEGKACLYSLGSKLSPAEFDARMDMIDSIGQRFQESPMIPRGVLPERYTNRQAAEVEKYEERLSAEAVKIHGEGLDQNKNLPWDACVAEAKKRIGQNGHAATA